MERKFSGYSHIRYSIEVGDNVLVEVVNSNQEVSTFSGIVLRVDQTTITARLEVSGAYITVNKERAFRIV
jgi:hypothetical protein